MTYLLDTDFVIDYLAGQQHAKEMLVQLLPHGVAISIVTYSEIFEGIYGSRDPNSAEQGFTAFLQEVAVLPLSSAVAKRNARIRFDLRSQKRPITHRALDLVIAATSLEHDLTLVTRNRRDYEDIPGLVLYPSS